jgi:hypothetical protein
MSMLAGFARFWYDFIIGDDWTIAAAVVVALVVTILLVHLQAAGAVWWIVPVAVLAFLGASLWRVARKA